MVSVRVRMVQCVCVCECLCCECECKIVCVPVCLSHAQPKCVSDGECVLNLCHLCVKCLRISTIPVTHGECVKKNCNLTVFEFSDAKCSLVDCDRCVCECVCVCVCVCVCGECVCMW